MAGGLAHYSPEDVDVLIAGMFKIQGFVEGTFINIEKDESFFKTKVTSDGRATRVLVSNPLYTVKLSLASTSESNQVFTRMLTIDALTSSAKFPLIIKDRSGGSVFFSGQSWIEEQAIGTYSNGVEARQWVIKCSEAVFNIGGNENRDDITENIINLLIGASPQLRNFLL